MWARDRAILLLAGRKSAPFRMRTGTSGAAEYIASVQAGKVVTRGKRKGTIRFGSRAKTLADAYRTTRAAARQAGGVLLNERALINALTVQRREKSRLATAAQVLPKRYRTVLKRMAGREYRGGQLVGVSSTDAAMMQEHAQVLIQNRKGRQIGSLVFGGFVGASVNIRGEMGLHTQDQVNRLARVLTAATDDTMAYIRRKQGEIAPGISRK